MGYRWLPSENRIFFKVIQPRSITEENGHIIIDTPYYCEKYHSMQVRDENSILYYFNMDRILFCNAITLRDHRKNDS